MPPFKHEGICAGTSDTTDANLYYYSAVPENGPFRENIIGAQAVERISDQAACVQVFLIGAHGSNH